MSEYDKRANDELSRWQERMQKPASFFGQVARNMQDRINRIIPEKIHGVITAAIKQMTRTVIFGAEFTTGSPAEIVSLEETENRVMGRIRFYRNAAAAEGGIAGAGGILLSLADFPIWLSLKMKMLFEIAGLYGYDTTVFQERIYILHIFQITFSSQRRRNEVYRTMADWNNKSRKQDDMNTFDWRSFQQEYRDSIDLAKLLQLVPGIGAAVGAIVNHRLTNKLGTSAMNAYRLRMSNESPDLIGNQ